MIIENNSEERWKECLVYGILGALLGAYWMWLRSGIKYMHLGCYFCPYLVKNECLKIPSFVRNKGVASYRLQDHVLLLLPITAVFTNNFCCDKFSHFQILWRFWLIIKYDTFVICPIELLSQKNWKFYISVGFLKFIKSHCNMKTIIVFILQWDIIDFIWVKSQKELHNMIEANGA